MDAQKAAPQHEWSVRRSAVDEREFDEGRIGVYRLGSVVRRTAFGEVIRALSDEATEVVELDLFDAISGTPLAAPGGPLMADLALVAPLQHRHLWPIIGGGFAEGVPYVVRPYRLGRTLHQLFNDADTLSTEASAAILFAVADALDFLAEQGPFDGSCAMGGLDARDVYLCFDGSVGLVGLGLKHVRGAAEDPMAADLFSLFRLARELDQRAMAMLPSAIAGANSAREVSRALRRRFSDALGASAHHVGLALRRVYATALAEERARFGLSTLQ